MKKIFSILPVIIILCLPCIAGAADMYKWVDENGVTHFSDRQPAGGKADNLERIENRDMKPQFAPDPSRKEIKWPRTSDVPGGAPESEKPKEVWRRVRESLLKSSGAQVELYTTSWCGYCKKAKTFFNKRGIPFVEYDIEKDRAALKRKQKLSPGSGVPVAVINGRPINGFSPALYESALKKRVK